MNANLYLTLRQGFPANLDAIAIETDQGLCYSWRDIERGSAMLEELERSLQDAADDGNQDAVIEMAIANAKLHYTAGARVGVSLLPELAPL